MKRSFVILLISCLHGTNSLFGNECGRRKIQGGLIYGGKISQPGHYPWIAALKYEKDNSEHFFCGATLITSQHMLTAAHCIQGKGSTKPYFTAENLFIYLGVFNVNSPDENTIKVKAEGIQLHPDWNATSTRYDADIALITLTEPVLLTDFIQPVCLPPSSAADDLSSGTIVGWGRSGSQKDHEDIVKEVKISRVENQVCFIKYPEITALSSTKTFCAGGNNAGPCSGDSGSGYFVQSGSTFYINGIVSSSLFDESRNCDVSKYSIFTNVAKYHDWIIKFFECSYSNNLLQSHYATKPLAFESKLNSIADLPIENQPDEFRKILIILNCNGGFYHENTILFAYKLKQSMNHAGISEKAKHEFDAIKAELPYSISAIIFNQVVRLQNTQYSEFMYTPDPEFAFDGERLRVFTSHENSATENSQWMFETTDEGRTFYIKSTKWNEYLYRDRNEKFYNFFQVDKDRKMVFTKRDRTKPYDGSKWRVELVNNDNVRIRNEEYGEYLFVSTYKYDDERRHVFTWGPGNQISNGIWEVFA